MLQGCITRRVRVDRTRTPGEVIAATGRVSYVDDEVLAAMPVGEGDEVEVCFVPIGQAMSAPEMSAFLALQGLDPDPRAQATVNEQDPAFADNYPNGTQWGETHTLTFDVMDGERRVKCGPCVRGWAARWFVAGVRKRT